MEWYLSDLLPNECLVYLDDIVVHPATIEEHLKRLDAVFRKLHRFGLKLNPSIIDYVNKITAPVAA